jgi:GNAT superfamily N-acetyltransferase
MTHVAIRRAEERDLPTIAAINISAFRGAGEDREQALRWANCLFRSFPLYQFFVAELDGVAVAYIGWEMHGGFRRKQPVIELEQLAVAQEFRGQKIAPALIDESLACVVGWIKSDNPHLTNSIKVIVWAYSDNLRAMEVYQKTFRDGTQGLRVQYDGRAEKMLRHEIAV